MKFATKLTTLLLGIVFISILFISFFVYYSNVASLENEISNKLEDHALHLIDKIDQNVFERYSNIQIIASDKIISSPDSTPKEITERLLEFRNTYKVYSSLSFFDLDRIRIADTAGLKLGEQHDLTKYWEDVLAGKISAASDIRIAEELKVPIIYFASPVKDENGKTFGVVVARMPSSKIYDILESVDLITQNNYEVDLINREGLLLYSNHNFKGILHDQFKMHLQSIIKDGGGSKSGVMTHFTTISKKEALMAFAKQQGHFDFKGNGWILLVHVPLEEAFAPAIKLRNRILLITLILGGVVLIISLYFSRKFTKPINQLFFATQELEKGNFKTRVNIKTKDEFQELGESFNKTISVLAETEEKRKQIDQTKTRFLSITSHELRSPMTPLKAQLQMLDGEYFGKLNPKQKEAVSIVIRNADHLDNIIVDFLEISRIEAARLKFVFEKVSLNASVKELLKTMSGFMPEKKIKIVSKIPKLPVIEVDADRVDQVLRNLVNNAIKFSPDNKIVEVKAEIIKGGIVFSVKDQGIGMKLEDQRRIFEPFYQAEQTMYRKKGGTGLGLAICRGIVKSQEGKIWLESAINKGTTFYFTVPFVPVREIKPIKLLFSTQEGVEKKIEGLFKEVLGPLGEK